LPRRRRYEIDPATSRQIPITGRRGTFAEGSGWVCTIRPRRSVCAVEVRRRQRPGSAAGVRSRDRGATDETRSRRWGEDVATSPLGRGRSSNIPSARRGAGKLRSESSPGLPDDPSRRGRHTALDARKEVDRSPGRARPICRQGSRPKTGTSSASHNGSNPPTIARAHRERPPRACRAHP
jgi:hypothetical protein